MKRIIESSLTRIMQHIENRDFVVISAYNQDLPDDENLKRHYQLMKDIRSMKYGYIEMRSGYTYQDTDIIIYERSLFIPSMSLKEGLSLGKIYQQETIISKNENIFALYNCNNGKIEMNFRIKINSDGNITFDKDIIKYAFSQLIKANKSQRVKFAYLESRRNINWCTAMAYASKKKSYISEWIRIL